MRIIRVSGSSFRKAYNYLENTSLHGLKYIIDKRIPWIERILWVAIFSTFLYYACSFMAVSLDLYANESTNFGVETTYLDWNTTFPAVSLCAYKEFDEIYNPTSWQRSPCRKVISNCKWLGEFFDCCANFLPVPTEFGICYTINSIQINGSLVSTKKIKMISSRLTGPGLLKFNRHESMYVVIHSPEDIFTINYNRKNEYYVKLDYSTSLDLAFQVTETVNDPDVKKVPIEKRECRFPDENTLTLYPYYSYSACITECRAKAQIDLCGCYYHFQLDESPRLNASACNRTGMNCLSKNYQVLKTYGETDKEFFCNCLPSCSGMEFSIQNVKFGTKQKVARLFMSLNLGHDVVISMIALPIIRFRRDVVRDELATIVDMGGIASLFFGAGFLSIIEIIYYFCVRSPTNKNSQSGHRDEVNVINDTNKNEYK